MNYKTWFNLFHENLILYTLLIFFSLFGFDIWRIKHAINII